MRVTVKPGNIEVVVSKRNLLALLAKVDEEWSQKTIFRQHEDFVFWFKVEPDEIHYAERPAGAMHPETELAIPVLDFVNDLTGAEGLE